MNTSITYTKQKHTIQNECAVFVLCLFPITVAQQEIINIAKCTQQHTTQQTKQNTTHGMKQNTHTQQTKHARNKQQHKTNAKATNTDTKTQTNK